MASKRPYPFEGHVGPFSFYRPFAAIGQYDMKDRFWLVHYPRYPRFLPLKSIRGPVDGKHSIEVAVFLVPLSPN